MKLLNSIPDLTLVTTVFMVEIGKRGTLILRGFLNTEFNLLALHWRKIKCRSITKRILIVVLWDTIAVIKVFLILEWGLQLL